MDAAGGVGLLTVLAGGRGLPWHAAGCVVGVRYKDKSGGQVQVPPHVHLTTRGGNEHDHPVSIWLQAVGSAAASGYVTT